MDFDPQTLPIYDNEAEIVRALNDHRVVILEGPTGSGKTTQLPKILRRAQVTDKMIGVTQPRRIAAVSVAWRIAEELEVEVGGEVGYTIRFDDRTSSETTIRIMTDGILLQEARTDPLFSRYGVIMVDEAHERSLNIDFTLGLLHRALQERDDLKVVVSSATLQPEVFRRYFQDISSEVPMVSVKTRPYPIETIHRSLQADDMDGLTTAVSEEILRIHRHGEPGHILAFLTGEAMIRGTDDKIFGARPGRDLRVFPLYGKLTRQEQERVFDEVADGERKVVLSTNIAETSITVPGVRYVIDCGLAKVPRVHRGTGITTLREEGISRASADQRAGRAGRTGPGTVIRLYSKKSYRERPEFTDEEILRLDLKGVVMRLISLGIHDIESFPLPTQPPRQALKAAIRGLMNMGAIDDKRRLTPIGERMMPFPLDPSVARMVVEAADRFQDVVDEVLMVGAFMSSRPPYLYPPGEENEARAAQRGLAHPLGDAMTAVTTMTRYQAASNKVRFCEQNYLDVNIMAFVAKAFRQLSEIAENMGIPVGVRKTKGNPDNVVRCVAAGFADNILKSAGRVYEGVGDVRIAVHPSSSLFGERAQFIVAAEIVISHRAYARNASKLLPEWVADVRPDLAKRWRIRTERKTKREARATEELPSFLTIGGVNAPVERRRGRPWVDLPVDQLEFLRDADISAIESRALHWRAGLVHDGVRWGRHSTLVKLLCILPHIPLPEGIGQPGFKAPRFKNLPFGAFLETDRNIHAMERFLGDVLKPGFSGKGRYPGWVTLVSNGQNGYWFELVEDYPDALQASVLALRDLAAELPDDDRFGERVQVSLEAAETRLLEIGYALDAARRIGKLAKKRRRPQG